MKQKTKLLLLCVLLTSICLCFAGCSFLQSLISPQCVVTLKNDGDVTTITAIKGESVELPTPTKEGYKFGGWKDTDGNIWDKLPNASKDITLTAVWEPNGLKITFVVDNSSVSVNCAYGQIPVYPDGVPTKQPDAQYEYPFQEWQPALKEATEDATYTAVFGKKTRTYNVLITANYPDAFTAEGTNVETGKTANVKLTVNPGYKFEGWYQNGSPYGSDYLSTSLSVANVTADVNVDAKFSVITYTVRYYDTLGCANTNPIKFDVTINDTKLQPLQKSGHLFVGWFTQPNGAGKKIESLTVEQVIANPDLYAYFTTQIQVHFIAGGKELSSLTAVIPIGGTVSAPIVDPSAFGMSAYEIDGWYTDEECTIAANFSTAINSPTNFYAKWTCLLNDNVLDYFTYFNSQIPSGYVDVTSETVLYRWIDYINFYNVYNGSKYSNVKFRYPADYKLNFATKSDLSNFIEKLNSACKYPGKDSITYSYSEDNYQPISLILGENNDHTPLNVVDKKGEKCDVQYQFAFTIDNTNPRNSTFENFAINNVDKSIEVDNTNQLVFALESGLKPLPKSGSAAERIYENAKSVLRKIVNDDMTDLDKARAIYEWLILNVRYDNAAASSFTGDWRKYNSWYAEGVFDSRIAVCDGISKAYLIMCRIENIACIRVTGTSRGVGHAWNKIYVDGNWWGVDATHGDLHVSGEEYPTYTSFMFTDDYKRANGCTFTTESGKETASKSINVYEQIKIGGNGGFDLYINSREEFDKLVAYVKSYTQNNEYYTGVTNNSYFTIEFAVDDSLGWSTSYICSKIGKNLYVHNTADGGISVYAFKIDF